MKVFVDKDEMYPYYTVTKEQRSYALLVDMPDKIVKDYVKAERAFNKAWKAFHAAYLAKHED